MTDIPNLPQNWTYSSLAEWCTPGSVTYGVVQPGTGDADGVPMIRVNNFGTSGLSLFDLARIDPAIEGKYERTRLLGGEVLVTVVGSVGQVAVVPKEAAGFNVARAIAVLHPKKSHDAPWLLNCLRSPMSQRLLGVAANTTVQVTINLKDLRELPIPTPPLDERVKILEILTPVDDRIELLRETNATLEAIAQALFKSWFVDFDPVRAKSEGRKPEGIDDATAALFPDSFEDSPLGPIPTGWAVRPFLEICGLQGGSQPPASEFVDTPRLGYVRLLQIRDFSTDGHETYVPIAPRLKIATADDVLIGRYGSASGDQAKDSLGRICRGLSGAINVALMKLVPLSVGREFALQLVKAPSFYNYLQGVSSKAVQSGFSKSELAGLQVVVPADPLLQQFEEVGELVWKMQQQHSTAERSLTQLRDSLLPRLISGRLRVPDQESAEV